MPPSKIIFDNVKYMLYILNIMKTVKKAFDIIKLLSEEPETFHSSGSIADALNMKKPTCSLLLKALAKLGAVEQLSVRGGYRLGYLPYYLTRKGPFRKYLTGPAHPFLVQFAEKTGETIMLSSFYHNKRVILDCVEGSFSVQIKIKDLFLEDFYRTASGRVLISFLSPEDRKSFISNYGLPSKEEWKESSTYEGLEKSIGSICKKGEEMSRVMEKAYFQAAVPVLDRDGKCVAALAVPVPSFRFRGAQKKKIMTELRSTAWKISAALSQTVPA